MAEYLTRDLKLAISAAPELTYNDFKDDFDDVYLGMLTTGRALYIPDKEKQDDTGKVGTGREFPTEQRSGYVVVPSLEISEELNIDIGALLLKRAMGGADSSTVSGDAQSHKWNLLENDTVAGRQLPSSTVVWALGGADYMWAGVVVESFRIDQTNADVPTFTAGLVGSGLYQIIDDIAQVPVFPSPVQQRYMLGAESDVRFNDGSLYIVTGAQRMKNFSMTLTNNHRTDDRRAGDPRIDSTAGNQADGNPKRGHYVNRMLHGDRTVGAEMTVMLDDVMREWTAAYDDTVITSFQYTSRGNYLRNAGNTADLTTQSSLGVEFPKSYFRSVRGADDSGDAVVTLSVFPVDNGNANSPMNATVINNSATVIA